MQELWKKKKKRFVVTCFAETFLDHAYIHRIWDAIWCIWVDRLSMISYVLLQHKLFEQLSDLGYRDVQRRRHSLHARQVDSDKEPVMVEGTRQSPLICTWFWPGLFGLNLCQISGTGAYSNLSQQEEKLIYLDSSRFHAFSFFWIMTQLVWHCPNWNTTCHADMCVDMGKFKGNPYSSHYLKQMYMST